MVLLVILGIAVGLAMDAFAVAVAIGIRLGCVTGRQTFRLAFHFGLFQFFMPIIGWLMGYAIEDIIGACDHWIALGLLSFIGGKMIVDAMKKDKGEQYQGDPTQGSTLLGLSIATSIDALAVGLSLGVLNAGIIYPSVIIGIVAGFFTVVGIKLGCRIGMIVSRKMEIIGGLILIGIGVMIAMEHLFK